MKKFTFRFTFLTFLLLFSGTLFAQWQQRDLGTAQTSNKMYALNSDIAFIVGNNKVLLRTIDKGVNWSPASVTLSAPALKYNFVDIAFTDNANGYTLTQKVATTNENGLILHSSDQGATWQELNLAGFSNSSNDVALNPTLGVQWNFTAIACTETTIYVSLTWKNTALSASYGYIFKSIDNGATWIKLGDNYLAIKAVTLNSIVASGNKVYIGGSQEFFKASGDAGVNWIDYTSTTAAYTSVSNMRLVNESSLYLATSKGIFYATNSGATITKLSTFGAFDVLNFSDLNVIFSGGTNANIVRNIDNRTSWEPAKQGLTTNIWDLTYFNGAIYALCNSGIIYTLSPAQLKDPVAGFTSKITNKVVEFTNTSLNCGSYTWDFGDGTATSAEVNPTHTYANLGNYDVKLISGNAVSQANAPMSIALAQSADFSFVVGNARHVTFTNLSQNYTGYTWDFGDGTAVSTDKDPVHTYMSYGTFNVKLTASDGVTDLVITKDIVIAQPTADFSFMIGEVNKATFTNLSRNGSAYTWDFGDGSAISTETNPMHTYNSAGNFNVKLTASDGVTSGEMTKQITISLPTPDYSYVAGANKTFTFTNLSQNGTSCSWDFGDGTTASAEVNPVHTYTSFGTYNVKLTAANILGSTEVTKAVDVLEVMAGFSYISEGGDKVVFTSTSVNCTTYSWDFGDGTALSTEANPSHTYTHYGDYTVKLVAGDGVNESSATQVITISQPVADFSYVIENGNKITITNLSLNSATYAWNFGDGSDIVADANPTHAYANYGKFIVSLTAGNSIGQVSSTKEVAILQPAPDFSYTVEDGNKIVFTNESKNCLTYLWDFAGLGNSTLESSSFAFPTLGSFDVVLKGNTTLGSANVTKTITIQSIGVPWTPVNTTVTQNLQKLQAFNDDNAIIVGNNTTIIRTSDGGNTWVPASFPLSNAGFTPNDMLFFDNQNGLISFSGSVVNNGFILKTTNNGQDWTPIALSAFSDGTGIVANDPMATTASKVNFYAMAKTSGTTGFVVMRWQENTGTPTIFHGYVYKTTDNGSTWTKISPDIFQANSYSSVINAMAFDAATGTGYICGVNLLLKTTDGGTTWTKITLSNITSFGSINDIIVKDANTVFLATQNGTIKTTDGFSTGSTVDAGFAFDIIALDETTYLSGKDAITLKISRDKGATWESVGKGVGSFFELAVFNNKVYALSSAGKAYISYLDFYQKPVLDFSYTADGKDVKFNNLSANVKSQEWLFGDDQKSAEVSPLHTYAASGSYSVTLNGGNLCWKGVAKTVVINIVLTGVDDQERNNFNIWPNPTTQGYVNLNAGDAFKGVITVNITDIRGRLVCTQILDASRKVEINLNPGMYLVKIVGNNVSATQKLMVK